MKQAIKRQVAAGDREASSVVAARLKLALVRPIVGLKLSPPIVHGLETGGRGDVLSEILRRVNGGGMGSRRVFTRPKPNIVVK